MRALLSEAYFQKLLGQPDGVEAISQFWAKRADGAAPQFGLTAPEYAVQLILIYVGEVGNGGHVQLFLNRGTTRVADTIAALNKVGLAVPADVLSKARSVWDSGDAKLTGGKIATQLDALDQDLYAAFTQVSATLTAYLKQHQDRVLLPERGMGRGVPMSAIKHHVA